MAKSLKQKPSGAYLAARTLFAAATLLTTTLIMCSRAAAQTYTILYNFNGQSDGAEPSTTLLRDGTGNLYGTALGDGYCPPGCGVVFKVSTSDQETVLHTFNGPPDGGYPGSGLTADSAGNAYGVTMSGGANKCSGYYQGCGAVFRINKTGESVVYSFKGPPDGQMPMADLIDDAQGNLYGTTFFGGTGCGTVFKVDSTGNETALYRFKGAMDGCYPWSPLLRDAAGNLYGTTEEGGNQACSQDGLQSGCGTIFRLDPSGKETVLYRFTGPPDGEGPGGTLATDGVSLYGTTPGGGGSNDGTIFKFDKSGKETILHTFEGSDGVGPTGVIRDQNGNLYGTTTGGGNECLPIYNTCGTAFELDAAQNLTILHYFDGADGQNPLAGLIRDAAGHLYGTTQFGGTAFGCVVGAMGEADIVGCGVVFKIAP